MSYTRHAPSPQVLSAAGTGLERFLVAQDLCPDQMFGNAGLNPRSLDAPITPIGLNQYCDVLERSARHANNPLLGLHFGQQFTPDMLGLVGHIALASPTVLDAAANLARYFPYHQQATQTTLEVHHPFHHLTYRVSLDVVPEREQDAIVTLGMFVNVFRHCDPDWVPECVHLEQPGERQRRAVEDAFGAPVVFGCATNALVFRASRASGLMPQANPSLLNLLVTNLATLGMAQGKPGIGEQIKQVITRQMSRGQIDLDLVCAELSLSRRTLQRRITQENTSFAQIIEEVRRTSARRLLSQSGMRIGDVALALGYSETSAFVRAFKRWYGYSPTQSPDRGGVKTFEAGA